MSWTDERVETLKKLWTDGLTARQIADMMGGGVTRNAIIGKVHRLGLSGRPKTIRVARPKPRKPRVSTGGRGGRGGGGYVSVGATALKMDPEADAVAAIEVAPVPITDLVIPISERKTILELDTKSCHWPYNDPRDEDFHFCGRETATDKPYCTHHCGLAYQPMNDRRRVRRSTQRIQRG